MISGCVYRLKGFAGYVRLCEENRDEENGGHGNGLGCFVTSLGNQKQPVIEKMLFAEFIERYLKR